MSNKNLHLSVAIAKSCNVEDVLDALDKIAGDVDCDFNGENGEEALWDEAALIKCPSNMLYTRYTVINKHFTLVDDIVKEYFSMWLDNYSSYYEQWTYDITFSPCGVIIALSYTTWM